MSLSRGDFDDQIVQWAASGIAHIQRVLDIGPGAGKYGHLLHRMKPDIDAVELNGEFVERFGLKRWYANIVIADIGSYQIPNGVYALIILGDIIEHLSIPAAQGLVERVVAAAPLVLVVIPFSAPESLGNYPGGTHLQGDLTPEVVAKRYRRLRLWLCNQRVGVYFAGDRAEDTIRLSR